MGKVMKVPCLSGPTSKKGAPVRVAFVSNRGFSSTTSKACRTLTP